MNSSPASPPSRRRSAEIHPMGVENDGGRPPNKHTNRRAPKPSFSRQVSLETGFSALVDKAAAGNDDKEKTMLARSGKSFGGFSRGNGGRGSGRSGEVRGKGDFNIFRTKSTITKQNSLLPIMKEVDGDDEAKANQDASSEKNVPTVGRYFAALKGPELDQIKESEDTLLPKDELWPFLLRFPVNCFGICLGLSSQAILWSALSTSPATAFLHIPPTINLILWLLAAISLVGVAAAYALKCALFFEAVRREFHHPVRVNFFFAPFIATMFLAIATPPSLLKNHRLHPAVWCVLMAPVAALELRIYGEWLSGGRRRLSMVANPSSHLSVVGNFVGAILAAKVGWVEPAKFFWAVGFAHYMVVFVTLYQRLPSSEALPKELHPVYSMFIAAPSAASIAWQGIYGDFDGLARTCYFIALFLYTSLFVRINFFLGFRFSVAWWSYTFPMTTVSIATIKYAENVPCFLSKGLVVTLSFMSSAMVSVLFISTFLHAFVWQSLFPNDLAIAITKKKIMPPGKEKKSGSKQSCDIRRWAKQSPLSIVSSIAKNCHWDDKQQGMPENKLKPDT